LSKLVTRNFLQHIYSPAIDSRNML